MQLTPKEIVRELDRFIIGQDEAKRAVAVALRNRYRRAQLPEEMREEVTPKNILMIGPTGVGKTEIARRLAKLVDAPFVKVEATKFTEVGYVGRDVESIVRDLVEASIRIVKDQAAEKVKTRATVLAEDRILNIILHPKKKPTNPIDLLLGNKPKEPEVPPEEQQRIATQRDDLRGQLMRGELENLEIEVEVEDAPQNVEINGASVNIGDMMGGFMPKKTKMRRMKVSEARRILTAEEEQNLIDMDAVTEEALRRAEQDGIVFIDEIDKIAGRSAGGHGPDVSREGVQRDILPIVEGSTVNTKYGPVKTDFMLFIAAGAFHVAKVTDLIPELQGRFPVRVSLRSLSQDDMKRILTQTDNALTKQYEALLAVDHVHLHFDESALEALALAAFVANETNEDIGARRLHTIFEQLLEDISFNAGGDMPDVDVYINGDYVREHLGEAAVAQDLKRYIL
ncbi:ATP-dependent protease ATPase subunit HslU [Beduinella massiliensis]|uniref:ATP-dependent protease ATPase subunit HslU n=1 Tax=Beduinella massiliensis TaxID=1852363 RepID=UPI000C818026